MYTTQMNYFYRKNLILLLLTFLKLPQPNREISFKNAEGE